MITQQTASGQITDEVTSWPGVETASGDWGAFVFMVGSHELGHLHGDQAAHFVFPKQIWVELYEQGRIDYHPMFPRKKGISARRIENEDDVRDVIELLRLNYDRTVELDGVRAEASAATR